VILGAAAKQRFHPLPLGDSGWSLSGRFLRPFLNLVQSHAVLNRRPLNRNAELGHRSRGWHERVLPELRDGKRHGFVWRLSLNMGGMDDSIGVGEGDGAEDEGHGRDYTAIFAFCSPLAVWVIWAGGVRLATIDHSSAKQESCLVRLGGSSFVIKAALTMICGTLEPFTQGQSSFLP
jgi:hypothetical protein